MSDTNTGKTIEQFFADWESDTFGYGYGTGEKPILTALKRFLELCPISEDDPDYGRCYDYEVLEKELTPAVAWLLINALCKTDILEYGCSPRGAWLTSEGVALKRFVSERSVDQLFEAILDCRNQDYHYCQRNYCNCGDSLIDEKCQNNPFWRKNK